jgi:hypothetical protein
MQKMRALRDVTDLETALAKLPAGPLHGYVRHVVTENDRVLAAAELLRSGASREIGPLMNASHDSLRDDYRVSTAELDLAVETLRGMGAHGARMTGGGFGGTVIALVDSDRPPDPPGRSGRRSTGDPALEDGDVLRRPGPVAGHRAVAEVVEDRVLVRLDVAAGPEVEGFEHRVAVLVAEHGTNITLEAEPCG